MRLLTMLLAAVVWCVYALAAIGPSQAVAKPATPISGEATPTSYAPTLGRTALTVPAPYVPKRQVGQPVPKLPTGLPAAVDPLPEYQGQRECSPTDKVGTVKLASLLNATYATTWADIGISRACNDGGQSEHKEGRAIDWMQSYLVPAERAKVEAYLSWLLAPDANGNPAAMARRLGIMYMGWHDRFWASYRIDSGWTELKGCFSKQTPADDTYCHRDHLHMTLSWDAAAGRTSFWDKSAETLSACPKPTGNAVANGLASTTSVHEVPSWKLVDTRGGVGTSGGPCRLESDRWDGDGRGLEVSVLGLNSIPATGVSAVRIHEQITGVNAPTAVVQSANGSTAKHEWVLGGTSLSNTVSVTQNGVTTVDVVAPVSSHGTVVITNLYGAVDVKAWVTGWVAGETPPTPTPTPLTLKAAAAFPGGVLSVGSSGDAVTSLQKSLLRLGYSIPALSTNSVPYGHFGEQTQAAVQAYQVAHPKLGAVTGTVTLTWYSAITGWVPPKPVSFSQLIRGNRAVVRVVQHALGAALKRPPVASGRWDAATATAFAAFRNSVLHQTSVVRGIDRASLRKLGYKSNFIVVA